MQFFRVQERLITRVYLRSLSLVKNDSRRLTLTRFCGAGERGKSLDLLLIHDRTGISQRGMQSLSIVKHLQILKDRVPTQLLPPLRSDAHCLETLALPDRPAAYSSDTGRCH